MAIDPVKIKEAVDSGLCLPCAMCSHWWTAVDKDQLSCGKSSCGGPSRGRTFPDYKGPLPASQNWTHFCFVCGKPHDLTPIYSMGETRQLSVCNDHLKLIDDMVAAPVEGALAEPAKPIFVIGKPSV